MRNAMRVAGCLPLAGLCLVLSRPALAQTTTGVGASLETYQFRSPDAAGIERISLFSVPWAVRLPLARTVDVTAAGAWATGRVETPAGASSEIRGFNDTDVRLSVRLLADRLTLSAGYLIPTGHSTQTVEESEVAGAIASDLLPFRISNWGSGGGPRVDAAFTVPMGGWTAGLSLGYGFMGDFEPLTEDQRAYRPGSELGVGLTLAGDVGRTGRLQLQLAARTYGDDELDAQNLYRTGDRYQAVASWAFAAGARASGVLYGGVQHRERGTLLVDDIASLGEPASQDLILAGLGLRLPIGSAVLLPAVDGRIFRSADGVGQGYALGAGTSAELRAGPLVIVPLVRLRLGNLVVRDNIESGFHGLETALTVRLGGTR